MPGPKVFDRVKDTTATTGTGTVTLSNSAPSGFQTFGNVLSDGDTCLYSIVGQSSGLWECGIGTYTASGTTLARTTVLSGSSGTAHVSLTGTSDVFIAPLAEQWNGRTLYTDPNLQTWTSLGTPTVNTTQQGCISISKASAGGAFGYCGQTTPTPATPYCAIACFDAQYGLISGGGFGGFGMCWGDGTKLVVAGPDDTAAAAAGVNNFFLVRKMTNNTTLSANYFSVTDPSRMSPIWMRLSDNGTNRKVWLGADGLNWVLCHSVGNTDFLTPDRLGYTINPYSLDMTMKVNSFKFTTDNV